MIIALCGLLWIGFSALMARPGFFNYCTMRGIADKDIDAERVYQAARPTLLSSSWLLCTLVTTCLTCVGLWLLRNGEADKASQTIGLFLFLAGFGLLVTFHIVRSGRIWSDAVSKIRLS